VRGERLAKGDADLALIAANTPHIVFGDVRSRSSIPMASIVEATREFARAMGLRRVGLFGTRFTMQGRFFPNVFAKAGVEIVQPRQDEQAYIHDKYVNELLNGTLRASTREALLRLVDTQRERDRSDAVILAGSELPLLLTDLKAASVPLLDTRHIHVKAAVRLAWS
jgi:aspartate racemase